MSAKQVTTKLDWGNIVKSLGLTGSTSSSLMAFRRRNEDAKTKLVHLESQSTDIDFDYYRKVLKNQKVLSEVESAFKAFKPISYNTSKQIKTIEAFEAKALENAESTQSKVSEEIGSLNETLNNIKNARAFEELVVEDIMKAAPEVKEKVEEFIKKGRWDVPGYQEKFGSTVIM